MPLPISTDPAGLAHDSDGNRSAGKIFGRHDHTIYRAAAWDQRRQQEIGFLCGKDYDPEQVWQGWILALQGCRRVSAVLSLCFQSPDISSCSPIPGATG